jgi:isoleucyl-tRNA synthetase
MKGAKKVSDTTANTPKTANERELEVLEFWNENKIFEKSLFENKGNPSYTFYDGPPFATGLPHYGHLLQSYLKDSIPRFQTMKGKYVRRVWGWDTHGLPIENGVEKELGLKSKKEIEEFGIEKFTKTATDTVLRYDKDWKEIVPRLGRWVDMENHYMTMAPTYTESCWWAFSELYKKGLAYEGYKVMHICPRCETPLASSEVALNYQDTRDLSVYVKFELSDEPGTSLLAWTTTPWTLPGNTSIAINKEITYVKVKHEGEIYILAKDLSEKVFSNKEGKTFEVLEEFTGEKLLGKKYVPVFDYYLNADLKNKENIYKVWHADFVDTSMGTGIAHEAPAFGEDDYNLAMQNNIPTIIHLGMDGRFYNEVSDFKGERVKWKGETMATDKKICEFLQSKGKVFKTEIITHSYPLCWRCDTPLLNYATTSWFISVSTMREKLVAENKKIYWIPENVRDGRMGQWLEGARDWAVSRNRYWGAPIPVWKSTVTGEVFIPSSLKELGTRTKAKNKYIFIRHGETEANKKGPDVKGFGSGTINTVLGKDFSLDELGVQQVKDAVKELKDKNIDVIVSSPYKRTIETANIIADGLGMKKDDIVLDSLVQEFQVGELNEGKTWMQIYEENRGVSVLYDKFKGADETKMDVINRMQRFIYKMENTYEGKTILVSTHKSPIACMEIGNAGEIYERGTKNMPKFSSIKNAGILELEIHPLPHDDTGAVNFHLPHIDNLKVYDKEGNLMKRSGGVFDCWFESGSMPFAQFHYPFENTELFKENFPAEFIAEAQDQTRGWFYTMLVLGVGLFDKSPFRSVITSGMINASDGKKMSKRDNNYTPAMDLIEKYGSDAIRYYILSSPVVKGESMKFTDLGISTVLSKNINRLLNVLSFYNMYKEEGCVASSASTHVLDKYVVSRFKQVKAEVTKGFETLQIDQAFRPIEKFVDDLSVWYLRRSRDRFKSDDEGDRKAVLQTTKYILQNFAKVLAPIMPYTCEMIWRDVRDETQPISVHLANWGEVDPIEEEDIENVSKMENARSIVTMILEQRVKAGIKVRQPLRAAYLPKANEKSLDEAYLSEIKSETNIREVEFEGGDLVRLDTEITEDLKKEGVYRELVRTIQDKRKENNLKVGDMVDLVLPESLSAEEKEVVESMKKQLLSECHLKDISYGPELKITK